MDSPLRERYAAATKLRLGVEDGWVDGSSPGYQTDVRAAIAAQEECLQQMERLALFSPNETLEDITTNDLPYLLITYHLGNLQLRTNHLSRTDTIQASRRAHERFLAILDQYELLQDADQKRYQTYLESPQSFSTISTTDPNARRNAKVANYKAEKELQKKLEFLREKPSYVDGDEDAARSLYLAEIALAVHHTFQSLESLVREEEVLALAPPRAPSRASTRDERDQRGSHESADGYSDRLDLHPRHANGSRSGPILDRQGKPLQPFTLLPGGQSARQALQNGVFRPGHNLPTMSIDEYLEEERRRGGIIEGGGAQSGLPVEVDEDDYAKGEEETLKARQWDEFVEANPKGAGNTINRG